MNVLCAQTKAPGLRRGALAAGGRIEAQLLQGQPLNDREEKMRGLAGAILAMARRVFLCHRSGTLDRSANALTAYHTGHDELELGLRIGSLVIDGRAGSSGSSTVAWRSGSKVVADLEFEAAGQGFLWALS